MTVSIARQDIKDRLRAMRGRLLSLSKLAKAQRKVDQLNVLQLVHDNLNDEKTLVELFENLDKALALRHAPKGKDVVNYPNEIDDKTGLWKKDVLKSG